MSELCLAVIGAQKAGSSHVAQCIGEHPEVHMVPHEVPYFQNPFFQNSAPNALGDALRSAKPVGAIKRPDYLAAPEVPERLAKAWPNAHVLAVLRDPVDRIVSAYYWYVQFGYLPLAPLNDGLTALLDGRSSAKYPRADELVENSRYGTHLRRWAVSFETEAVIVMASTEVSDADTYSRIFDRLGIRTDFVPPSLDLRTNDGTYDMKRLRFGRLRRRFIFDWDDTDVYVPSSPKARASWRVVPSAVIAGVDRGALSRVFTDGPEELNQELRARLDEILSPELAMVQADYGLDLTGGKD